MINSTQQIVLASAQYQAKMRDSQIEINGIDVELLTNLNSADLTEFGQVSYYTERDLTSIKIVTDLENWNALLPFDGHGKVIESYDKKEFPCYVKTSQMISQGDLIRIEFSYFSDTVEPKYFQVKKVLVSSVLVPISKKIIIAPYVLPVKIEQTRNPKSDYIESQPQFNTDKEDYF